MRSKGVGSSALSFVWNCKPLQITANLGLPRQLKSSRATPIRRTTDPASKFNARGTYMRSHVLLSLTLITPCFLLLLCATPADAQCTANTIAFGKVGIVTGNPLRAEIVETSSDPSDTQKTVHELPPLSVARDSQGRVRTDRTVFTSNSTAASGTKVELHLILICDPVAQSTTQIDQLNATAKIMRSRDSSANSPAIQPRSLCSNQLHFKSTSNVLVEDLGTQSIEGIEAHGVRITRKSRNDTAAGEESANVERVSEL